MLPMMRASDAVVVIQSLSTWVSKLPILSSAIRYALHGLALYGVLLHGWWFLGNNYKWCGMNLGIPLEPLQNDRQSHRGAEPIEADGEKSIASQPWQLWVLVKKSKYHSFWNRSKQSETTIYPNWILFQGLKLQLIQFNGCSNRYFQSSAPLVWSPWPRRPVHGGSERLYPSSGYIHSLKTQEVSFLLKVQGLSTCSSIIPWWYRLRRLRGIRAAKVVPSERGNLASNPHHLKNNVYIYTHIRTKIFLSLTPCQRKSHWLLTWTMHHFSTPSCRDVLFSSHLERCWTESMQLLEGSKCEHWRKYHTAMPTRQSTAVKKQLKKNKMPFSCSALQTNKSCWPISPWHKVEDRFWINYNPLLMNQSFNMLWIYFVSFHHYKTQRKWLWDTGAFKVRLPGDRAAWRRSSRCGSSQVFDICGHPLWLNWAISQPNSFKVSF